jgi:REP element-mobilizing transposase RayT
LMPDHVHMLISIPPKYSVAAATRAIIFGLAVTSYRPLGSISRSSDVTFRTRKRSTKPLTLLTSSIGPTST